jgi:Fur family ferric uptake transcriptional regulator
MKKCCDTNDQDIEAMLKDAGFNITAAKKKILTLIAHAKGPLSSADIAKKACEFNESTIFRNLNQLSTSGLIVHIDLGEGFKRFELSPKDHHHHHIKCTICDKIEIIDTCDLSSFIKAFKKLGYKNISHKLEFFGECSSCL